MKLEFLGTGAADYLLERDCDLAEFRRFSSMMVDGELLFDPGPHIFHYQAMSPTFLSDATELLIRSREYPTSR